MRFIVFITLFASFVLCDGWAYKKSWGWQAKLQSPLYQRFYASALTQNEACDVYINNALVIKGFVNKKGIKLHIIPQNFLAVGEFDDKGNLNIKLSKEIKARSHIDVGFNTQISLSDSTKMVLRKNGAKSVKFRSNAKPLYELVLLCAYFAKF